MKVGHQAARGHESTKVGEHKRTRWSEADARRLLDEAAESGKTLRAFCIERGIDPQRLYCWQRSLGQKTSGKATASFLPVRVMARTHGGDSAVTDSGTFEVTLVSGRRIRVSDGFDEPTLRRLVAVLDGEAR